MVFPHQQEVVGVCWCFCIRQLKGAYILVYLISANASFRCPSDVIIHCKLHSRSALEHHIFGNLLPKTSLLFETSSSLTSCHLGPIQTLRLLHGGHWKCFCVVNHSEKVMTGIKTNESRMALPRLCHCCRS